MLDKRLIAKNFSLHAAHYDRYASVQALCAAKLIGKIHSNGFSRILDIGCGTGNFTRLLKEKFPAAKIKAIDIAGPMLAVARKKLPPTDISWIAADAETAELEETFDLIASNVSFQWFENLEGTLLRYSRRLAKGGMLSFSIFGPLTFRELNSTLQTIHGSNTPLASGRFMEKPRLEQALSKIFDHIVVEEEQIKEEHACLWELLEKIKNTGARGTGTQNRHTWTRRTLRDVEEVYRNKFAKIVATYQVFFCQATL